MFAQKNHELEDLQTVVVISDAQGQVVWNVMNIHQQESIIWNTDNMNPGVYFYTICDKNGVAQTGRVLVTK